MLICVDKEKDHRDIEGYCAKHDRLQQPEEANVIAALPDCDYRGGESGVNGLNDHDGDEHGTEKLR